MKQCPNGHSVGDNVKFCPECGAEIVDNGAKFCAKCGNERKGTEKFCSQCGTPFDQVPINIISDINRNKENKSKKGIIIASVVVLIALFGGAVWYFAKNQQDKYSLEGLAKAAVNYDFIGDFHEGLAMVTKGEKIGFIDKMGNEVIPCIYDFMEDTDCSFNDGLAFVRQGDSTFFIDKEGKKPFEFKYDAANHFSEGLAVVWKDGKSGYIDTKGNEVIALTDKYSYDIFSEGLAAVSKDDKYGFIDKSGNIVIPIKYEVQSEMGETSSFHEGLAMIINNGKCGFIDTKGTEVISCKYDNASDFSEGLSCVLKGEKYGYIDKSGKEIIPFVFDSAGSFTEGFAIVNKGDKDYFINKEGNEAFSCAYDGRLENFHNGLAVVTNYREGDFIYGVIDTSGKEIVPCKYAYMGTFSEGLAVVSLDGEIYGFIDKNGNSTFDVQNEEVKKIVDAKLQEKEEKRKQEEAEQQRAEEERMRVENERKESDDIYSSNHADVSSILYECQNKITSIQREIESTCRTFATLASDNNIDMMKYGQMKITFINGVNDLLNQANKAYDKCTRDLQQAGVSDAESAVNQEKRQFNRAINELKSRTLQQVEMSY